MVKGYYLRMLSFFSHPFYSSIKRYPVDPCDDRRLLPEGWNGTPHLNDDLLEKIILSHSCKCVCPYYFKDKRFVLVGRGIYALKEWGYQKGTVADIISEVLRAAGEPLHRDEIVKRVLKSRFVKETTILLNLQSKPQFKRVAKATYELAE